MCGRYFLDFSFFSEEVRRLIEEISRRPLENPTLQPIQSGEIFPSDLVPIIAGGGTDPIRPYLMKWGFTWPQGKKLIINARSETVFEKPMFRSSIRHQRCLIPAVNYYEWEKTGQQRKKYAIKPAGARLMYMAGIYRHEAKDAPPSYVILTKEAAKPIAFIHDRMPVIIPANSGKAWLYPGNEITSFFEGYTEELTYTAIPG